MSINRVIEVSGTYSNPMSQKTYKKHRTVYYGDKDQDNSNSEEKKEEKDSYSDMVRKLNEMCSKISDEILKESKAGANADTKKMQDLIKCLKIAKRIAMGKKVPTKDRIMLMEMLPELYRLAVSLGMTAQRREKEKEKSLWEDEEEELREKEALKTEDEITESVESISSIL